MSVEPSQVLAELSCRRDCLEEVRRREGGELQVGALLGEVEEAVERVDAGTWGLCSICHSAIEAERLRTDPLVKVCLECLGEADRRALELDLESAARVQASLLPPPVVRREGWEIAHHWEPLRAVSGDHVDLLLPERLGEPLYVLLSDVAGKGVAASLLQTHLLALFRAFSLAGFELPKLLSEVNRLFFQATEASAYATLVAVRLGSNGEIEMVNAGHPPALLAGAQGITEVSGGGLPVGMFREANYSSERFRLAPGETLMLYSDGWTESENGEEEYGRQRALSALGGGLGGTLSELLRHCRQDLAEFLGEKSRGDDLTLLAVRRVN